MYFQRKIECGVTPFDQKEDRIALLIPPYFPIKFIKILSLKKTVKNINKIIVKINPN